MATDKESIKELLVIPVLFVLTLLVTIVTYHASNTQTIVINEVCSNNYSLLQNSSGSYTDYMELYNASDSNVSLLNWTIITGKSELYTFGDIVLEPHAYLLLVHNDAAGASDDARLSVAHTPGTAVTYLEIPCAISSNGDTIYLCNSFQKTVDAVDTPALRHDMVYARSVDAGSEWGVFFPSPGADNSNAATYLALTDGSPGFAADELFLPLAEYSEFPVISIIMSEDDISGTSGIFLPENRNLSGRMSERPCQIDVFSAGLNYEFSEDAGIRIASRSESMNYPDFNLYARSQDLFSYSFFDSGLFYHKLELNHASVSEYLLHRLLKDDGLYTASLLPCTVFLNGEFWGEYYLTEPLDEQLLAYTYQLEADHITVLEDGLLAAGSQYAMLEYQSLIKTCADNGFDRETFDYFCSVVDIDSLIDYYAIQLFLNNLECSPYENCFVWRSEVVDASNPYADGKWHYEITGLGDAMPASLLLDQQSELWLTARLIERDPVFYPLLQNPVFRDMLSARMHALASDTFSEAKISILLSDPSCFYGSSADVYDEFLLYFQEWSPTFLEKFDELMVSEYL